MLRGTGPQVLPAFFNHGDQLAAIDALDGLAADLILPGHGNPLRMPIADAVREVREVRDRS